MVIELVGPVSAVLPLAPALSSLVWTLPAAQVNISVPARERYRYVYFILLRQHKGIGSAVLNVNCHDLFELHFYTVLTFLQGLQICLFRLCLLVHIFFLERFNQCFGSGSARIRIKKCLLDPDPGGKKSQEMYTCKGSLGEHRTGRIKVRILQ